MASGYHEDVRKPRTIRPEDKGIRTATGPRGRGPGRMVRMVRLFFFFLGEKRIQTHHPHHFPEGPNRGGMRTPGHTDRVRWALGGRLPVSAWRLSPMASCRRAVVCARWPVFACRWPVARLSWSLGTESPGRKQGMFACRSPGTGSRVWAVGRRRLTGVWPMHKPRFSKSPASE